jgi:hypothetical protein
MVNSFNSVRSLILLLFILLVFGASFAKAQNKQSVTWVGITFTLNECRYAGGLVTCYLEVISHEQDRSVEKAFSMSGPVWTLTDNLANTFPIRGIRVGNQEGFRTTLVADLPTPLVITSEFNPDAKSIRSLDLNIASGGQNIRYLFRNVPVINDSPQVLSDKPRVEYNGVTIAFESCSVVSSVLTCNFTALSSGRDSRTDEGYCIGCRQPRIVDNLANEYGARAVIYGNRDAGKVLVADTLTPVRVILDKFSPEATSLALLEIRFQDTIINFRNLPIDSGSTIQASKDNIALNKPIYITTNGAEDTRDNCNNPKEIADGSLLTRTANCSGDGVVGFQNNDYNELMEVTVKIDLGQTYNITKIRYNQGNVQRAETWNADVMISPFGSLRTNKGMPNQGRWTEQVGSVTTSILEIKFQKTRRDYPTDWLFIGEIEVVGTPDKPSSKTNRTSLQQIKIGLSMDTLSNQKSLREYEAFSAQCEKLQVYCVMTVANANPNRQENDIDGLLTQGVDILIVAPVGANYTPALSRKIRNLSIPVINFNSLRVGTTINLYRAICSIEGARGRELCNRLPK